MDECDRDVLGAEVLKITGAAPDEVVDLTGSLDPAVACPDDDEGKIPLPALPISARFRLFHLLHDVRAERDRVADIFERKRVIGHAGHGVKVRDVPAAEDEMLVLEAAGLAVGAAVFHFALGSVEIDNLLSPAANAGQQLTQGHDHVQRVDRRANHVCQQRGEDEMVLRFSSGLVNGRPAGEVVVDASLKT